MIDLHTHILPAMDDGSASAEETEKLIAMLRQQGVTTVAATPHFYPSRETPQDFLRRRQASLAQLPDALPIPLILGAEVTYFSGMSNCKELPLLQLGNTGLLLVEMPFTPWNSRMIEDVANISRTLGLIPVLAHVDRYRRGNQFPKYRQALLSNGALFQCNADVFETFSGRLWALGQLKEGYLHFLGSDCHNLVKRPPKLDLAKKFLEQKLGVEFLAQFHLQANSYLNIE